MNDAHSYSILEAIKTCARHHEYMQITGKARSLLRRPDEFLMTEIPCVQGSRLKISISETW